MGVSGWGESTSPVGALEPSQQGSDGAYLQGCYDYLTKPDQRYQRYQLSMAWMNVSNR